MDQDHRKNVNDQAYTAANDESFENGPICRLLVFLTLAPDAGFFQQDRALGDLDVNIAFELLDALISNWSGMGSRVSDLS